MNLFFLKSILIKNSLKNNNKLAMLIFNENKFLLKLNNASKKQYINFYFKINKNFYHTINFSNKAHIKNTINILELIFFKKKHLLFIDSNYNYLLPILNKIYNNKILYNESNFFFLNTKFITTPNWLYNYSVFLNKYDISIIFFLDFLKFKKFMNIFFKLNLPIIASIPFNYKNFYVDYCMYFSELNKSVFKIIMYNYIYFIFFKNYNFNLFLLKNFFISQIKLV